MEKNEIIVYQSDTEDGVRLDVRIEDETVWLTQAQMADLFSSTKQNISLHINNLFKEKELLADSTVKEYLTVQKEGLRNVQRKVSYYNLDVIISVGYRVKSVRGTQFRIWATGILRDYLIKGYVFQQKLEQLENKVHLHDQQIKLLLHTSLPAQEGIFFNGQVFDAYTFVADLIRSANKSLILIDNYIDDTVFTLLNKRKQGVSCVCYTQSITKNLSLDLEKHNQQYPVIDLKELKIMHDRFLIIDESELYHIGASLKDLGKRWFAFSKLNWDVGDVIRRIEVDNPR